MANFIKLLGLFFLLSPLIFAEIRITTLDNHQYVGEIVQMIEKPELSIIVKNKQGKKKRIAILDIVEVVCRDNFTAAAQSACVILNDGSRIFGEIVDGNRDSVTLISPLSGGTLAIDLTIIRQICFGGEPSTTEGGDPDNDMLYFKNGDSMMGLIDKFGKGYIQIDHSQLGMRKEYLKDIKRIVFAELDPVDTQGSLSTVVLGIDGSKLQGKIVQIDNSHLILRSSLLNTSFSIPLFRIQRFFFVNGRFVYLSDLPADHYKIEYTPYFEGPKEPFLPRFDLNQSGKSIALGKRIYHKGIGVLPRTKITIRLDKKYQKFQTYFGLDDQVRHFAQESPRMVGGSVTFSILVDGKKTYQSKIMRWDTDPKMIEIDLTGKSTLELLVDFADNAHVNDFADWAGARLVK